ncbi:hypothetical protein C8J56DRAFT_469813 [Mycena floridula]|nr:hypothetical protein C8J56DRAFT_469813 [Mycena floridula]
MLRMKAKARFRSKQRIRMSKWNLPSRHLRKFPNQYLRFPSRYLRRLRLDLHSEKPKSTVSAPAAFESEERKCYNCGTRTSTSYPRIADGRRACNKCWLYRNRQGFDRPNVSTRTLRGAKTRGFDTHESVREESARENTKVPTFAKSTNPMNLGEKDYQPSLSLFADIQKRPISSAASQISSTSDADQYMDIESKPRKPDLNETQFSLLFSTQKEGGFVCRPCLKKGPGPENIVKFEADTPMELLFAHAKQVHPALCNFLLAQKPEGLQKLYERQQTSEK